MAYDSNNIFAKILKREIPAEIVFEDESVMAFHDVSPAAPIHVLVVPKGEYSSFDDFVAEAEPEAIAHFFKMVRKVADEKLGLQETGYRLITNYGKGGNQTVLHFHVHILAGKPLGGLLADDNSTR